MLSVLLALQAIQVAFLWLHDWVPLPPLNDVAAIRATDSAARLIKVTVIQSAPYTAGLAWSLLAGGAHVPAGVMGWLWVSYGVLFVGELRAWWVPYLWRAEPERAVRYQALFGRTAAFLPARNGIVPNALHCGLHACTGLTLLVLAVLSVHASP